MSVQKPYKVVHYSDFSIGVVEQPTDQVILKLEDPRAAKTLASFLNGGNGFNGCTPAFFTHRMYA